MSTLPIYLYGTEVLRKKAEKVKTISEEDKLFIKDMLETMYSSNGIGLAANQVGVAKQILVVDISDTEQGKGTSPFVIINPTILLEEGSWEMEEGCLSIPEIREKVTRAETIRIQYNDEEMNTKELIASGLLGRVLLHEIDHLNGVLFIDHISATQRMLLKSKLRKISNGEVEIEYPFVITPKKKK